MSVPHGCPLTRGEFLTLEEIVDGKTPKQIAHGRGVKAHGVYVALGRCQEKLGVPNTVQAVLRAFREGWIDVPSFEENAARSSWRLTGDFQA